MGPEAKPGRLALYSRALTSWMHLRRNSNRFRFLSNAHTLQTDAYRLGQGILISALGNAQRQGDNARARDEQTGSRRPVAAGKGFAAAA